MKPKHILATILILFFCISCFAQSNTDTIRVEIGKKKYRYFVNHLEFSKNEITQLLTYDPKAYKFVDKYIGKKIIGAILGGAGGGCLGYGLVYYITRNAYGNNYSPALMGTMIGAGIVMVSVGIVLDIKANSNFRDAIEVYNHSVKQKNNPNLHVGFAPTGICLKLNL